MSSDRESPRRYALGLLARRDYSRRELAERLCRRGYDRDQALATVEELASGRAVSDERYAEERVRGRGAQGVGPLRIMVELKAKGVPPEIIAAALASAEGSWGERAVAARAKRFGGEPPRDREERARQARFLQTRGFRHEDIMYAVRSRADNDDL